MIATGGRPRQHPNIPADIAITSDDLFSLKEDPGKTLVVGGGYIAVECAGFLAGVKKDVTLINRSTFLRAMDSDMAYRIVQDLEDEGVKALTQTTINSAKRLENGQIEVNMTVAGKEEIQVFDTVLVAIGRDPNPASFSAQNAGIEIEERSKKIVGRKEEPERTSVDHIYAVGDCVLGVPELMPVAQ